MSDTNRASKTVAEIVRHIDLLLESGDEVASLTPDEWRRIKGAIGAVETQPAASKQRAIWHRANAAQVPDVPEMIDHPGDTVSRFVAVSDGFRIGSARWHYPTKRWCHTGKYDGNVLFWSLFPNWDSTSDETSERRERAWLVESGAAAPNTEYRYMDQMGFHWTKDINKAIRFARREDAEMAAAGDEDAWSIVEHEWVTPSSPEEPSGDESNIQTLERTAHPAAQVAGDRLETTVAQFVTRAQHLLIEEQEKPNPDNALVGFLCDAVRLAREHSREATAPIGCTCGWMRIPDSPDPMDCRRYRFKAGCSGAVATGVHPIYPDVCPACARPVRLLNPSPNDVVRWICPVCSTVNDNRDERCCVGTCKGVRPNPWPFCDDARDAARYRYLRERLACDRLAARKLVITTEGGREPYRTLREAELDREIDECIGSSVEPKTQQVYPPPGKQNCTCKKTCERHGMPFPPGWPWQCQGFPYEPREIDRLPEKASACNCRSLPEPPSANCPIHGDDICAECGAELVSDTCDKCGAENGGEKHGD